MNINRMDPYHQRNLNIRTHPEQVLKKVVGITGTWQNGFICTCSFHNWFPDMQIFLWIQKIQQLNKRKEDRRRNFKDNAQKKKVIRVARRGPKRRFKEQKEERK